VLVVCPSSARHHWRAELITVLGPMGIGKNQIVIVESAAACNQYKKKILKSLNRSNNRGKGDNTTNNSTVRDDSESESDSDNDESNSSSNNTNTAKKGIQFVILSYSLLCKFTDVLGLSATNSTSSTTITNNLFKVIIVDESHYMKSKVAQRTKVLLPLLHRAKRAILLSGNSINYIMPYYIFVHKLL
jgi:SNF2 family DNA or RNA helicase